MELVKSRKIESLNGMRGLLTLIVMLEHLNVLIDRNLFHGIFNQGWFGVDFFFVLSGFLLFYNYQESENRISAAVTYVKKRFVRIFPVYWIYSAITLLIAYFVLKCFGAVFITWTELGKVDIFRSMLCADDYSATNNSPIIPSGWTLTYELIFYVVGLSLIIGGKKVFRNVLVAWSAAIVVFQFCHIDNSFTATLFSKLFLELIAGVCLAALVKSGKNIPKKWSVLILSVGFILLAVSWTCGTLNIKLPFSISRVEKYGIPFVLIVYGLVEIERGGVRFSSKILSHFAMISYSLYLTHFIVIVFCIYVFNAFCPGLSSLYRFIISTIACLITAEIAYVIVEKNVVSIFNRLLNNRIVSIAVAILMAAAYLFLVFLLIF